MRTLRIYSLNNFHIQHTTVLIVFIMLYFTSLVLIYLIIGSLYLCLGFPGGSVAKNLPANAGGPGDVGLIPGSGRFPGEENGNPLQYSCLENPTDGGTWWATGYGVAKSWTRLSDWARTQDKTRPFFVPSSSSPSSYHLPPVTTSMTYFSVNSFVSEV